MRVRLACGITTRGLVMTIRPVRIKHKVRQNYIQRMLSPIFAAPVRLKVAGSAAREISET